jgi:hypothetical protein
MTDHAPEVAGQTPGRASDLGRVAIHSTLSRQQERTKTSAVSGMVVARLSRP